MTVQPRRESVSTVDDAVRSAGLSGDAEEMFRTIASTVANQYSATYAEDSMTAWRAWKLFADHHDVDPLRPRPADLVAFVHARAIGGISYGYVSATLAAVEKVLDVAGAGRREVGFSGLTTTHLVLAPARQFLSDLWGDGVFSPAQNAPALTLGEVIAMSAQAPTPLARLLVVGGYRGALRPGEWQRLRYPQDVGITNEEVTFHLRRSKTGPGRIIRVSIKTPIKELNLATALADYMTSRGEEPGQLVLVDGQPAEWQHIRYRLRLAAAAAGVAAFAPYSLRRSWAVHANLSGASVADIRRHLGHSPTGQVFRRYIEPLLSVQVAQGVNPGKLWLDRTPPLGGPVPIDQVVGFRNLEDWLTAPDTFEKLLRRNAPPASEADNVEPSEGRAAKARRNGSLVGFAAGSIDELLEGIDVEGLTVHPALAHLSGAGVARVRSTLNRFEAWAQSNDCAADGSDDLAPALWAHHRMAHVLAPTVCADLTQLQLGFVERYGHDRLAGLDVAQAYAAGALRKHLEATAPGKKSRASNDQERTEFCETASAMVSGPSLAWAVLVLAKATRAKRTIEVLAVEDQNATVLVDGSRHSRVKPAGAGVMCPVVAARVAVGVGSLRRPISVTERAILSAAQSHTRALRDRLLSVVLAGSGARPSDVARARARAVRIQPGGLCMRLAASKGQHPDSANPKLIWAPNRAHAEDPVAAWNDWCAWWRPDRDQPLVPAVLDVRSTTRAMTSKDVGAVVQRNLDAADLGDLRPYGFRYGRATEMHVAGYRLETIAEVLGHRDTEVTRGYIFDFDPDADGWSGRTAAVLLPDEFASEESALYPDLPQFGRATSSGSVSLSDRAEE